MSTGRQFCSVLREGGLFILTIERPEAMNALHPPACHEMAAALDEFQTDPELHVAILTASGERAFCSGKDLKFQATGQPDVLPTSGFGGITARFDLDKPVIAAVNGVAMGGGFEIVLACDMVVAVETAAFSLPEPRVGLMASAGGLLRLPHLLPPKLALEMLLTSRRMEAAEAHRHGLVNRLVPQGGGVLKAARELAAPILAAAPLSVRASKHIARRSLEGEGLAHLYAIHKSLPVARAMYESEDRIEGPRAFAEKRAPRWVGR